MPVISVTALSTPANENKVLMAGFDAYPSKPIIPETFIQQVEAYLPPKLHVMRTKNGNCKRAGVMANVLILL